MSKDLHDCIKFSLEIHEETRSKPENGNRYKVGNKTEKHTKSHFKLHMLGLPICELVKGTVVKQVTILAQS